MAILHRKLNGLLFSNWFGEQFDQNLIQIQLHPDFGQKEGHIFQRTFGNIDGSVNFQALWQTIEAERAPAYRNCPDCTETVNEVLETVESSSK